MMVMSRRRDVHFFKEVACFFFSAQISLLRPHHLNSWNSRAIKEAAAVENELFNIYENDKPIPVALFLLSLHSPWTSLENA